MIDGYASERLGSAKFEVDKPTGTKWSRNDAQAIDEHFLGWLDEARRRGSSLSAETEHWRSLYVSERCLRFLYAE